MLNKKYFSFQFLSSQKLHQINFSAKNVLLASVAFIFSFVSLNYYLSLQFSTDYYKDELKKTDEKYSQLSKDLLDKITELENELKLIEDKDSELRTYATLPPLSEDLKAQGTGGSIEIEPNDEKIEINFLDELKNKVDSLSYAVNVQKDSYNTIFNKIKSNEEMYSHIPSISPVKGYIGSGYGYRTDPIDKKRRMHSGLDFAVILILMSLQQETELLLKLNTILDGEDMSK